MNDTIRTIPATELFATEIGISGSPLPSNGPGRKSPLLKYIIVGGIVVGAVLLAYHLHKKSIPKIKFSKNGDRTDKD